MINTAYPVQSMRICFRQDVDKEEKITTYKDLKNGHNRFIGFTVIKAKIVTMTNKFVVTVSRR